MKKLRTINAEDAPLLAKIHAMAFPYPWTVETFHDFLNNPIWGTVFGWITDSDSCGFILLRKVIDSCDILTVAVAPIYQGKGVGQRLLTVVCETISEEIILEVAIDNLTAIHCYEKFDFLKVAVRPCYYEEGEAAKDAYLMRRTPLQQGGT